MRRLLLALLLGALPALALAQTTGNNGASGSGLPTPPGSGSCLVSTGVVPGAWHWASCSGSAGVTSITQGTGLTFSVTPLVSSGTVSLTTPVAVANGGTGTTSSTGSGSLVLSTSPTLVTPALGTPSALTLTNATGLPPAGITSQTGPYLLGNGSTGTPTAITVGSGLSISAGTITATGSGAVSSVTAGSSGSVTASPTTGAVIVDLASQATATVLGNVSGSSAAPTAVSMTSLQSALVAANATLVSATAPTGPTNDYSPAGWGTNVAFLYLTPTAGGSTINGLVAGSNAQQVFVINAEAAGGSDNLILKNQSTSDTTAANRFMASGDLAIPPGGGVSCIYLAGSVTRWWCH